LRTGSSAPISLFAFQDIIFAATGVFLLIAILMTLFGKIDMIAAEAFDENIELREELDKLAEQALEASHKLNVLLATPSAPPTSISKGELQTPEQTINPWLYQVAEFEQQNRHLRQTSDLAYQQLSQEVMAMNRNEHRLELLQSGGYLQLLQSGQAIVRDGSSHDFREPIFLLLHKDSIDICYLGRPQLKQEFNTQESLLEYTRANFTPKTQSMLIYLKPSGISRFYPLRKALTDEGYSIGYEPASENLKLE
jgi:hypothetical protein